MATALFATIGVMKFTVLLLVSSALLAQNNSETDLKSMPCATALATPNIPYGTYITGCNTVNSSTYHRFRFIPQHNDEVYIHVNADAPVIIRLKLVSVSDTGPSLWSVTDDVRSNTEKIPQPNPVAPVAYEVTIRRASPTPYRIILDRVAPHSPAQRQIQLGELVKRSIQYPGELQTYSLKVDLPANAGAGARFAIRAKSLSTASADRVCLRLRTEDGELRTTAPCPEEFVGTLTKSGSYGIVVWAFDSRRSPTYELFADRIFPASPSATSISYNVAATNQSIASEVAERYYTFYDAGGDRVTVTATGINSTRAPCVYAFNPEGNPLTGAGCPSSYSFSTIPGYYVLRLTESAVANARPQYNLLVTCTGPNCSTPPPPDCFLSLSPATQIFPPEGGRGSFGLISSGSCPYTATALAPFVTLTGGAAGVGSAGVGFTVGAHTGAEARQTQVRVTSQNVTQIFTLVQAGRNAFFYGPTEALRFSARPDTATTLELPAPIFANRPGLTFVARSSTQTGGNWLSLRQASGTLPTTLLVNVKPQGLRPGRYEGLITVTSAEAPGIAVNIPVVLDFSETSVPEISIAPRELKLIGNRSTLEVQSQLTLTNTGGVEANIEVSALTAAFGGWLTATPSHITLAPGASAPVRVTAATGGLGSGSFTGSVRAKVGELQAESAIQVAVGSGTETMILSQRGLTFTAVEDGGVAPAQTFGILNRGSGVIKWSIQPPAQEWLRVDRREGSTDGSAPTVPEVQVTVRHDKLAPGEYTGSIEIASLDTGNSPQVLTVVLNVLPRGSDPGPLLRPSGLIFAGYPGSAIPAQTVRLSNLTDSDRTFTASATTLDGNWLAVNTQSQTLRPGAPVNTAVSVRTSDLAPGIYFGVATFLLSNGLNRTANVTLFLVPEPKAALARNAGGPCQAGQLVAAFTDVGGGLAIRAGHPQTVRVRVLDACGAVPDATVTVRFSSGENEIELISLKDGHYEGSWVPQISASSVQLTANIRRGELYTATSTSSNGSIVDLSEPPFVPALGITPLTPGGLFTITGLHLAGSEPLAGAAPFPSILGETRVVIRDTELHLMRVARDRIDALVPSSIVLNEPLSLQVRRGRRVTPALPVTVAAYAPVLFEAANEAGPISGTNPVAIGSSLTLFGTGFGAVDGTVVDGTAAPEAFRLRWRLAVLVGGQELEPEFAGLVPGAAGLYQVKFKIPDSAITSEGNLNISVRVEDRSSAILALPAR